MLEVQLAIQHFVVTATLYLAVVAILDLIEVAILDLTETFLGSLASKPLLSSGTRAAGIPKKPQQQIEIPLNCFALDLTRTCPTNYPTTTEEDPASTITSETTYNYYQVINGV
ncbi:putative KDEL motif-containing protein 1 precursor [Corchorus olitorius]|uniref:KDEL motif-containing protein 1 n=1 Tax=Corchorus olitorius TaxID=93759 RepID=A0A1R3GSS2_9ROSI|nr:putative KDEL motif-containing protein 1 precursor [Corchorus olitorius]